MKKIESILSAFALAGTLSMGTGIGLHLLNTPGCYPSVFNDVGCTDRPTPLQDELIFGGDAVLLFSMGALLKMSNRNLKGPK